MVGKASPGLDDAAGTSFSRRMRSSFPLTAMLVASLLLARFARAEPLPDVVDRNRDGRIVIACLGDSNTASGWQQEKDGGFPPEQGWCEQVLARLDDPRVSIVNRGVGGATASPHPLDGQSDLHHAFFGGDEQLDAALEDAPLDVAMMAFGTNDVLPTLNGDPESIVDHYNRLWRRERSRGLLAFVAITPPVFVHEKTGELRRDPERIAETNARIAEIFPRRFRLPFDVDMTEADFMDDLHMNARGQAKRADAAIERLRALARVIPPPAGVRALRYDRGRWGAKAD